MEMEKKRKGEKRERWQEQVSPKEQLECELQCRVHRENVFTDSLCFQLQAGLRALLKAKAGFCIIR